MQTEIQSQIMTLIQWWIITIHINSFLSGPDGEGEGRVSPKIAKEINNEFKVFEDALMA